MYSYNKMERPKWLRRKEAGSPTPLDSSQDTGRGRERYSWKKLAIHLGLIATGAVVGWIAGGIIADSVNWSIGTHPIGKGVFQFVGGMTGMFAGGLTAELSTAKMPGRVYL